MKRFSMALGIFTLVLAAAAGAAIAQGAPEGDHSFHHRGHGFGPGMGHGPGMHFGERHLEHLAEALELTAEQQEAVEALHEELQATVRPLVEQKHAAMRQLHEAVEAGSTDACALGQLVLQAHGEDDALEAAHERFEAGLTALLTPEQKTRYEEIKSHRPRHRRHGPPADDTGGGE